MRLLEALDHAVSFFRRQGTTSYRALHRRFAHDDVPIEATKAEAPSAASGSFEAERRQLTVLFCDVVGSTTLSTQLDPEDLREVIRAYQAACAEVIQRFEGSIAQYLGDGLLVYFSYPQAHEDDPKRAVHAGLEMIRAVALLAPRLEQDYHVRLSVRIGIHTGLVVVGDVGSGQHRERLALGETPNIAAWVQGLAAPDTVVISATTSQLVQSEFDTEDLGLHSLKGGSTSVRLHRVLESRGAARHRPREYPRGLTPLIGREEELQQLLARWQQVRDGGGQVVVLSGDAGMGKSRLIQTLKVAMGHEPHVLLECWGSPYYQRAALYPIAELFQRAMQLQPQDTAEERLRKIEGALAAYDLRGDELVPLLVEFLSIPAPESHYPPVALAPQLERRTVLQALVTVLLAQAADHPVLFILEDLHWLDPSTLEFLTLLIDQVPSTRLYVILSCRPGFPVPWSDRPFLTLLRLQRLSGAHTDRIIAWTTGGKSLPEEIRNALREKTDGIPLYIEEMTRAVLESGLLHETEHQHLLAAPLAVFAIPMTLHDSLMARLDRLGAAKQVAQLGAVLGREFSHELLLAVSPYDEPTLRQKIAPLLEAELLYQHGPATQPVYVFKHALIQDAAYQSLSKSVRQGYHERIARVLEARHADDLELHLLDIAHHLFSAGRAADATHMVHYGRRAADHARASFAWREAAHYYAAAVSAGEGAGCLTPQERAALHYMAGFASYWTGDLARCLDHYDHAIELYRHTNDLRGLAQVLIKRTYLTVVSSYGGLVDVQPLEDVLASLGEGDPRLSAHLLMAIAEIHWIARQPARAELTAQRALDIGMRLDDYDICSRASFDMAMAQNQSLRVRDALDSYQRTRSYARRSRNLWFEGWPLQRMPIALFQLGRFDEAARVAEEAREFASKTNNWGHYSLAVGALTCLAVAKGDFAAVEVQARQTLDLLSRYHFPYGGAMALPALACAHSLQGERADAEAALQMLMEPGRVFGNPEPSFGPMTRVYRQLIQQHTSPGEDAVRTTVAELLDLLGTQRFDVTSVAPYCALVELSASEPASDATVHLYAQLSAAMAEGILFSRGWVFCLPRVLGVAATIGRQWQAAERHFEHALDVTASVGAGPELGLTCLGYARMLVKRGGARDHGYADDLLQRAGAIFRKLRMVSSRETVGP